MGDRDKIFNMLDVSMFVPSVLCEWDAAARVVDLCILAVGSLEEDIRPALACQISSLLNTSHIPVTNYTVHYCHLITSTSVVLQWVR